MKKMSGILGAALLFGAVPVSAAVQLKVGANNLLLGATGVVIGKGTYNVDFVDGSCITVYGACTQDRFDFKTKADADAAANALFTQVLKGRYYSFDPGNITGCASTCDIFIARAIVEGEVEATVAANRGNRQILGTGYLLPNFSTVTDSGRTYAKFTLQVPAAVPEPATWAMMLGGFGMIGATARYRRRSVSITYA